METTQNISDAGLYTDFNGLQKLRAKVTGAGDSEQSQQATKEVAQQFETLFLQMMLKSMRDASSISDSQESDQTRFYQEMFDKQIALDLANNKNGGGLGIADLLAKDMGGSQQQTMEKQKAVDNLELIRKQLDLSSGSTTTKIISEQE